MKIYHATSKKTDGDMQKASNRKKFIKDYFPKAKLIVSPELQQGAKVEVIRTNEQVAKLHQCDGLITKLSDVALTVQAADCFSVFFQDKVNGVIGIAHVGWRGTRDGLPGTMVRRMLDEGAELSSLKVALGPGIRECHFEVQNDVWEQFYEKDKAAMIRKAIDLPTFIKIDMAQAGVEPASVEDIKFCTFCLDHMYFSFRRDKKLKTQIGAIVKHDG